MKALVGYTGFVGSNIAANGHFDGKFNSSNIEQAYGIKPDLLIYAGIRAEKYLANTAPDKDLAVIRGAEENIRRINPKRLVLISTIDVFKEPRGVDERADIDVEGLHPYGYNRYQLELWVREHYPDALIIRLPALFGNNIKKNFIYDMINVIPFMLKPDKFEELAKKDASLRGYYSLQDNGFYRVRQLNDSERSMLKKAFLDVGFSALNFTDSRSRFQFYNLDRLWADIVTALDHGIELWHPATEPVSAAEVYRAVTGSEYFNELPGAWADYDFRTIHAEVFGGTDGYICRKAEVLEEITRFIQSRSR